MASTEVTLFQGSKLPAHITGFDESNITNRGSVPQLSIMGKVWRTIIGGKDTALTKVDAEGDTVPVSIVRFIVLQHNQSRSRSFFEGDFDPKKPAPPVCWSNDGIAPTDDSPKKQASRCAKCKQSIKGSKINENGKETVACAQFKRVAIIAEPATRPDAEQELKDMFPPMLLKLPQTSLWDKDAEGQAEKGWYAWDQYLDFLRQNGVKHTGLVVTKAKFDNATAFPKVLFKADRFVEADQLKIVKPMFADEDIAKLLDAPEFTVQAGKKDDTDEDTDTENGDDDDIAPVRRAKKGSDDDAEEAAPVVKKKAKAAPVDPDDDDAPVVKKAKHVVIEDDEPAPKKKVVAVDDDEEPVPKRKKAVVVDDDEEAAAAPEEVVTPKAKKKAVVVDDDEEPAPVVKKKAVAVDPDDDEPAPVVKKKKAVVVDDDEEPAPVAKKKTVAVDPDDDDDAPVVKKKKAVVADDDDDAPAAPAKKKGAAKGGDDISNLLKEWPDDE